MLNFSRDQNEGTYRSGEGRRARYVTPNLTYYWDRAREQCEDYKWDGKHTYLKNENIYLVYYYKGSAPRAADAARYAHQGRFQLNVKGAERRGP